MVRTARAAQEPSGYRIRALPVLILSMHDESLYAERALRAGANGYIMKQEATERVLVAIRRILGGEVYVSDRIANGCCTSSSAARRRANVRPWTELTDRELEVFRLIGEGHGTRQIAEELHLSVKTVESYQAHIKEKLSLQNARELVQQRDPVGDQRKSAVPMRRTSQWLIEGNPRTTPHSEFPTHSQIQRTGARC